MLLNQLSLNIFIILYRACAQLRAAGGCGLTRIVAQGQDGRERIYIVPTASLNQQGQRTHPVRPTPNPSAPLVSGTTTIVITPEDLLLGATGRRFNPNMPPSYDQAVTGSDRSVKVEEGAASVPINVPTNEETIPPPEYIQFGNNEDQRPLLP